MCLARLALLSCVLALFCTACGFGKREDVLILVRADHPASRAIADYYADARGLSSRRILELSISPTPVAGTIDREGFEREIAEPIERYLEIEDPKGEIGILVTTLGIPVQIGHCDPRDEAYPLDCRAAAVDAALAGLGRWRAADTPLSEIENPFFRETRSWPHFRREEPDAALRFLVARLTGPLLPREADSALPTRVRELIDHARPPRTPHAAAPRWLIAGAQPRDQRTVAASALLAPIRERLPAQGFPVCDGCAPNPDDPAPGGVVLQSKTATDPPAQLAFPGLVIGLGAARTPPGTEHRDARGAGPDASAAGTSETPLDRFVAGWVARGAGAISTHLADPSLAGVTRPTAQLEAWAAGRPAVEAHFNSVPNLGWMNVFVGDPLLAIEMPTRPRPSADALSEPHPSGEPADTDRDGIADVRDNCVFDANPQQRDSDGDGIGNRCDPDVNNDGRVATSRGRIYPLDARGDLEAIALTARNGPYDPDHDLDGDGQVDERDVTLAQLWLFRSPGPSGLAEARPED